VRESSIRGLRVFCAAARHLSFKAAAEELCVTPSAVSHQIKALEERLQAALFERRTRELALTQLGSELRGQIEPLLHELDNVAARFEQRLGRRRVLRISVTPFFASELLVQHLRGFVERNRAVDLRIETTEVGAAPAVGCDAWILLLPGPPPAMVARPLLALKLAPACSPRTAQRLALTEPRDLLDTTLIVHDRRPHAWQDWFAHMGVRCEQLPKAMHFDSLFAVARAAERDLGVALLPVALCQSWFATGTLVQPCSGELETPDCYYFVHRADGSGNSDVAALGNWLSAELAAVPPEADRLSGHDSRSKT
jgi:LysR family glycine cleavage system transcriptional activator